MSTYSHYYGLVKKGGGAPPTLDNAKLSTTYEKLGAAADDPSLWFQPYDDQEFHALDVDQSVPPIDYGDGSLRYKLLLSVRYMSSNKVEAIAPDPKYPRVLNGSWGPYGSREKYWTTMTGFVGSSTVVGELIAELKKRKSTLVNDALELIGRVKGQQPPADYPCKKTYCKTILEASEHVGAVLTSQDAADKALVDPLGRVLNPMTKPDVDTNDLEPEFESKVTPAMIWHYRLLYGLVLGIGHGEL